MLCGCQGNGLDGRDAVCRQLCLSPSESSRNSPLLLELIRRVRQEANQVIISVRSILRLQGRSPGALLRSVTTPLLPVYVLSWTVR